MASVIISGDTSGTVTLSAPAVAGSTTQTLPAVTGTVALTSDVIGVGQTWQDVTASRAVSTTYTNATGKPIMVVIRPAFTNGQNVSGSVSISGVVAIDFACFVAATNPPQYPMTFIVPNGGTYILTLSVATIGRWTELR